MTFCVGDIEETVEAQVHGTLDNMEAKLSKVGLTLESVLMKDSWNIPAMEKVLIVGGAEMNILGISGTPRKGGNSEHLLSAASEPFVEAGRGVTKKNICSEGAAER